MDLARHAERIAFENDHQKLAFMQDGAEADAVDPRVVELATRIVRPFRSDAWRRMASEIHRWVRDGIKYQRDPNRREQLADAWTTISRGYDDCDGKARVAVAMARAVGLDARVWPVWRGDMLAHVQAAYRWEGSRDETDADADGWIVGELTIEGAELGQDPRTVTRRPNGRLPIR